MDIRLFRIEIISVPQGEEREAFVALLAKLAPSASRENIEKRLQRLPFFLNRTPIPEIKARKILGKLLGLHVEARLEDASPAPQADSLPSAPPSPAVAQKSLFALRTGFLLAALLAVALGAAVYLAPISLPWDQTGNPAQAATAVRPIVSNTGAGLASASRQTAAPTAESLRQQWLLSYRPGPDRRFLEARRLLVYLATGRMPAPSSFIASREGWRLTHADGTTETIPRYQNFDMAWAWLRKSVPMPPGARNPESLPQAKQAVTAFWAPSQLHALNLLDLDNPAGLSAEGASLAAEALLNLALQANTYTEERDPIQARALAMAVAAEARGADVSKNKILLAWNMNYGSVAIKLAQNLPDNDPLRLAATGAHRQLFETAQESSDPRIRYVAMVGSAGRLPTHAEWVAAWIKLFPNEVYWVAAYNAALATEEFEYAREVSLRLLAQLIDDTLGPKSTLEQIQARADLWQGPVQAWEKLNPSTTAETHPFSRDTLRREFLDSAFWGSLYAQADFRLTKLSSIDSAQELLPALAGNSAKAKQFQRWYQHLIGQKLGQDVGPLLTADLKELDLLPPRLLWDSFDKLQAIASWGDPKLRSALASLVARIDERSPQLEMFSSATHDVLRDRPRQLEYLRVVARTDPARAPTLVTWLASQEKDYSRLDSLAENTNWPLNSRVSAVIDLLDAKKISAVEASERYRQILDLEPNDYWPRQRAAESLEKAGLPDSALSLIDPWLHKHREDGGFYVLYASTIKANLLRRTKRPMDAWRTIEPVISSQQFGVLDEAAHVALALGNDRDAKDIARLAYERYPDSVKALALNMELLWRDGAYAEAARLAELHRPRLTQMDFRDHLTKSFVEAFPKPQAFSAAEKALDALATSSIDRTALASFAFGLSKRGVPKLAFHLARQLQGQGMAGLQLRLVAYRILLQLESPEQAGEWLRSQIGPRVGNPVSMLLYQEGMDNELWTLIGTPAPNDHPEAVWLLRAASAVRAGLANHPHREELFAYFEAAPSGLYQGMGRALLGIDPVETIANLPTTSHHICEIAYYLGVKAESDGHADSAIDWYETTLETNLPKEGEYRWAYDRLAETG